MLFCPTHFEGCLGILGFRCFGLGCAGMDMVSNGSWEQKRYYDQNIPVNIWKEGRREGGRGREGGRKGERKN